ncbi:hypothetical protein J45TS6_25110 [Paenibacillus sp. J45TS6]|uniref:Lipoprotein n=1 Tax=Paenibacillus polygoni TaxID=3050112 RepID=A0ABY8X9Z2_9BACL|nr:MULTISPECIES: hypothetical protein [Paenibacillus]WIV20291.1 hypothetical protein QPK24_06245 [Paenibacillus polygoni]GIP44052.1 hypothetical protein J45TS6_25110 [Paenibacillus sp. J45TS6]
MKKLWSLAICFCLTLLLTACGDKISPKKVGDMLSNEGIEVTFGDNMEENYYHYFLNKDANFAIYFLKDTEEAEEQEKSFKDPKYKTFLVNNGNLIVYYYMNGEADQELDSKISNFVEKFDELIEDK